MLPANSLVHVTIYQYDGDSGLRNPFISQATGTVGGTFLLNGKTDAGDRPRQRLARVRDPGSSACRCRSQGVPDSAKNPCGNAPCPLSTDHETISFTFRTRAKGLYRWQCFVPVRRGLHPGLRRADADRRLHGRLPQGRVSRRSMSEVNHFRRVLLIWLVASIDR